MMLLPLLLVSFYSAVLVNGLQNGLARTPPMGWLSWQRFRCQTDCENYPDTCISEKLYMSMADRLVEDGYKDVGYEYVNIDDCWSNMTRDADGNLNPDAKRFPSGMKALADYVHSKGLKLGIYGDYGTKTCAGYPGSLNYMEKDANRFAEWGIDMFKMDGCNSDAATMKTGYPLMRKYLEATNRSILFSCSWPDYERAQGIWIDYRSVAENCNIWRNYVDIQDSWDSVTDIIDYQAINEVFWGPVVGPGNFSDPDMLIIGDYSLSETQAKSQMALWAMMAAPLLMSNDLRTITPEFRKILLNKEVIAVSQDPLGIMGKRVLKIGNVQVWTRPLEASEYAVVVFNEDNSGGSPRNFTLDLKSLRLTDGIYDVQDIFLNKDLGNYSTKDKLSLLVAPVGCRMLHFYPSQSKEGFRVIPKIGGQAKVIRAENAEY